MRLGTGEGLALGESRGHRPADEPQTSRGVTLVTEVPVDSWPDSEGSEARGLSARGGCV